VAATKSFTSQIVTLILMCIWISYHKSKNLNRPRGKCLTTFDSKKSFATIAHIHWGKSNDHKWIGKLICLNIKIGKICHGFGQRPWDAYCQRRVMYLFSCLKIKEVTYIQAEAYMCAEMKHGPIALIDSNNPGKTKGKRSLINYSHSLHI